MPSWQLLLERLTTKVSINHLSLTINGGMQKEAFLGHTCFANRLADHIKGIKTFDLVLMSRNIPRADKDEIQEQMREVLIAGYKQSKQAKLRAKRSSTDDDTGKKPVKKTKTATRIVRKMAIIPWASTPDMPQQHQTKLTTSPKSQRLGLRSAKPERQAAETARQTLLTQYDHLKTYALAIDANASPVKIRLEDARKAVEAFDEVKFQDLAYDICVTLDERANLIAAARENVARFPRPTVEVGRGEGEEEQREGNSSQGSFEE